MIFRLENAFDSTEEALAHIQDDMREFWRELKKMKFYSHDIRLYRDMEHDHVRATIEKSLANKGEAVVGSNDPRMIMLRRIFGAN